MNDTQLNIWVIQTHKIVLLRIQVIYNKDEVKQMVCEKLLQALIQFQVKQGGNPGTLRLNPDYYKIILEQLAYPEWLIKRKMLNLEQTFLGIKVELTHEVQTFEIK